MRETESAMVSAVRRWLSLSLEAGTLVSFVIMVVSLILQILFRYVLAVIAPWTEELARFACVWTVFLGAAVCFEEGRHIKIDILIARVSRRAVSRLLLFINIFVTGTFTVVALYGSILLLRVGWEDVATTIPVRMGVVYLALPISLASIAAFAILRLVQGVLSRANRPGVSGERA